MIKISNDFGIRLDTFVGCYDDAADFHSSLARHPLSKPDVMENSSFEEKFNELRHSSDYLNMSDAASVWNSISNDPLVNSKLFIWAVFISTICFSI